MKVLETERLVIRWINFDDGQFVIDILNSTGWLDYIGDRNVKTLSDAHRYIKVKMIRDYDRVGYGMYVLEEKKTGQLIGMSGLVNRPGLEGIDLGFAFLEEYHGKGFAFEANVAIVEHAKQKEIKLLKAITLPSNIPSRKLLEKLGFNLIKEFYMQGDPELLCLYEMKL